MQGAQEPGQGFSWRDLVAIVAFSYGLYRWDVGSTLDRVANVLLIVGTPYVASNPVIKDGLIFTGVVGPISELFLPDASDASVEP